MILAGQKDDKLVIIKRDDVGVDTEIEVLSADEGERFANAMLATVLRVRETEQKLGRTQNQKIEAEAAALEARASALRDSLNQ